MKFLTLFVCLMATIMVAYARTNTIADAVSHGRPLPKDQLDECYESANLEEADLFTREEVKSDSYKNPENKARVEKNGCFALCVLQKRGTIIELEDGSQKILKDKLSGGSAHSRPEISSETRNKILRAVDNCVEQVETVSNMCNKSLDLVVCLWKEFI